MTREVQDKTARLILGIILVLIAIPALSMIGFMGSGFGMMGSSGLGAFSVFWTLAVLGILILGVYLIFEGLRR